MMETIRMFAGRLKSSALSKINHRNAVKDVLASEPGSHFFSHHEAVVCLLIGNHANTHVPIRFIRDPEVFAIDSVLSKSKHPSASIGPDDSSLPGPRINLWGICLISGLQFYVCLYENGGQLSMEKHLSLSPLPPLPHPFISPPASSLSLPPFFFFNPQTSQTPRSI